MDKITLVRKEHHIKYTVGELQYRDIVLKTLELPWLDNLREKSCIPVGEYRIKKVINEKLGKHFDVLNVNGRVGIKIHAGNYVHQVKGCILVGVSYQDINGDGLPDVTASRKAMDILWRALPDSCTLQVVEK
jgi:hypothetical protein